MIPNPLCRDAVGSRRDRLTPARGNSAIEHILDQVSAIDRGRSVQPCRIRLEVVVTWSGFERNLEGAVQTIGLDSVPPMGRHENKHIVEASKMPQNPAWRKLNT